MADRYADQGACLISYKRPHYMKTFDEFSPEVRKRLRESPYDLCCACVNQISYELEDISINDARILAIEQMENKIRCQETTQAQ